MSASRKERQGRKGDMKFSNKTASVFFGRSIHDALKAVLQLDFAEVDQKFLKTPLRPLRLLREA